MELVHRNGTELIGICENAMEKLEMLFSKDNYEVMKEEFYTDLEENEPSMLYDMLRGAVKKAGKEIETEVEKHLNEELNNTYPIATLYSVLDEFSGDSDLEGKADDLGPVEELREYFKKNFSARVDDLLKDCGAKEILWEVF